MHSLKIARKQLKLSQLEVANAVGVTARQVIRWEQGKSTPQPRHRMKLEKLGLLQHAIEEEEQEKMLRHSEHMAYRMYVADYEATNTELDGPLLTWDELTEEEQTAYLRHVETAFIYLFEHGRISGWISHETLEKLSAEYGTHISEQVSKQ